MTWFSKPHAGRKRHLTALTIAGMVVFFLPILYFLNFLETSRQEDLKRRETYAKQALLEDTVRFREAMMTSWFIESTLRKLDADDALLNRQGAPVLRPVPGETLNLLTPAWAKKRYDALSTQFKTKPLFLMYCGPDFRNPSAIFDPKLQSRFSKEFWESLTLAFLRFSGEGDGLIPWFPDTDPETVKYGWLGRQHNFRGTGDWAKKLGQRVFGDTWNSDFKKGACHTSFSSELDRQYIYFYALSIFNGEGSGRSLLGVYVICFAERDIDWNSILREAKRAGKNSKSDIKRSFISARVNQQVGFGKSSQGIHYISDFPTTARHGLASQKAKVPGRMKVLYSARKLKSPLEPLVKNARFWSAILLMLAVFFLFAVFLGKVEIRNIGLRLKLMAIVSLIVVFPMIGCGFQAWRYFRHLEEVKDTNLENRMKAKLELWRLRIKEVAERNLVSLWKLRRAVNEAIDEPIPTVKEIFRRGREIDLISEIAYFLRSDGAEIDEGWRSQSSRDLEVRRALALHFLSAIGSLENAEERIRKLRDKSELTYGILFESAWRFLRLGDNLYQEGLESLDPFRVSHSSRNHFFFFSSPENYTGRPEGIAFIRPGPWAAHYNFLDALENNPRNFFWGEAPDHRFRFAVFRHSIWGIGETSWPKTARRDPQLESIARTAVRNMRPRGVVWGNWNGEKFLRLWNFVDPYAFIVVGEASVPMGSQLSRFSNIIISCLLLYSFLLLIIFSDMISAIFLRPLQAIVEVIRGCGVRNFSGKAHLKTGDELSMLGNAVNQMIDAVRQREHLRRFVPTRLVQQVVTETSMKERKPEKVDATILMSDIRGFTTLSEKHSPEILVEALNDYFTLMEEAITRNDGIILKLIGDAVFAAFYPEAGKESPAHRGCRAAMEIRKALRTFNRLRANAGLFGVENGIGLATGEVLSGVIGLGMKRRDFTAIGLPVRLAGRLETLSIRGSSSRVIICEKTRAAIVPSLKTLKIDRTGNDEPPGWEIEENLE